MDYRSETEIIEKYRNATSRLVLLDYDGTLVKLTGLPETAVLPDNMTDIILKMVNNPRTRIFIITGRSHEDIDRFLNHMPVDIIAEHGAMVKENGIWTSQMNDSDAWKSAILPILNRITAECQNSYVEEKNYSLTWHYRNVDPARGYKCSRDLISHLNEIINFYDLRILDGNKVVEILTNDIGKGRAVEKIYEASDYDFVLSLGDDATDEEMFGYFINNNHAVTIKVGEGFTSAGYHMNSISEVSSLLKQLAG